MMHLGQSGRVQSGVALAIVLVFLMLASLLAAAAAQTGIQEQKAARNLRDRDLAFAAAEAALQDAETDIQQAPDRPRSRSALFARDRTIGFPSSDASLCQRGDGNPWQGLCRAPSLAEAPAWLGTDLADDAQDVTVRFGRFTGRTMPTGAGALPARPPRYLIEVLRDRQPGTKPQSPQYFYRVTAIGFGVDARNQVVLQSFYRKADSNSGTPAASNSGGHAASTTTVTTTLRLGRLGWRELGNWRELRNGLRSEAE
ncbi:type IV pilus assembly protein PilX [Actimicrobium sp. GrIS 1.19]|uniref:pilus assembly PilX family protein n=1 Tax=Actimicrobium sp. GrIS 1.19 TaxID=3071708 RepID=UPI002E053647|nr:type IV pilus assembly protein PilX [Actimicrobium sp. GrIS 1.19]